MREEKMNEVIFINTPLQRGARKGKGCENRFNGFLSPTETVKTVSIHSVAGNTLLKQGVNETWHPAHLTYLTI
jgi:hypothetical protein